MQKEAFWVAGDVLHLAVGTLEAPQQGVMEQLVVPEGLGHLVLEGLVAGLAEVGLQLLHGVQLCLVCFDEVTTQYFCNLSTSALFGCRL